MFLIICENIPDKIRGELTRFCYEIKPYVFLSTCPANTREYIWNLLESESKENIGISATLIYSDKTEQKFSIKTIKETRYKLNDFEGINLITKDYEKEITNWMNYYAKPDKYLHTHLIESGVIAKYLCNTMFRNTIKRISELTESDTNDIKRFVIFLAAIHDIGKMHDEFWKNPTERDCKKFRHEVYSEIILEQLLKKDGILDRYNIGIAKKIVSCHHQNKVGRSETRDFLSCCEIPDDIKSMYKYICKLFPYHNGENTNMKLYSDVDGNEIIDPVSLIITSIVVFADWLASGQMTIGLKTSLDFKDDSEYMKYLYDNISERCKEQYIGNFSMSYEQKDSLYHNIFGKFKCPNNIQNVICGYCDRNDYSLILIEDACGGGKTEAAIYAALSRSPGGVYFATPTTCTAQGLLGRVRDILKECNINEKALLYTGTSYFNEDNVLDRSYILSDERLKLMYPYVVGTIDQILMSVRKIPYYGLEFMGLLNKTVIIDEIHDIDYFQLEVIKRFLEMCKIFGIRVVMLSATLPVRMKKELLGVYGEYNEISTAYPLISIIDREGKLIQEKVFEEGNKRITLYEQRHIDNDYDKIVELAKSLIGNGSCICIRRNLIREVDELYDLLIDKIPDAEIIKFHSEMTQEQKDSISQQLLKKFGKNREHRGKRCIVIATSIIEQSLDIDFDYGISSLCPIGSLIQFIGRLRRHDDLGTIREHSNNEDVYLYVTVPESFSYKIYDESLLENTYNLLDRNNGQLKIPYKNADYMNNVWDNISVNLIAQNDIDGYKASIGTINPLNDEVHIYSYCESGELLKENKCVRNIEYEKINVAVVPNEIYQDILKQENMTCANLSKIYYKYTVRIGKNRFRKLSDIEHIGKLGERCINIKGNFIEVFSNRDVDRIPKLQMA